MTRRGKRWIRAASIRAGKTVAQAALAGIGTAQVMSDIDWKYVLSTSVVAGILSMLTSIKGLPEVSNNKEGI